MVMIRIVWPRSSAARTNSFLSSVWMPRPRHCTTTRPRMTTSAVRAARLRGQRRSEGRALIRAVTGRWLQPVHRRRQDISRPLARS